MALYDEIKADIKNKKIPSRFTTTDLLDRPCKDKPGYYIIGNCTYAESTLRTITHNSSISTDGLTSGNHVDLAADRYPLYYRYGNSTFSLISIQSQDGEIDCRTDSEGKDESFPVESTEISDDENSSEAHTKALDQGYDLDPVKIIAHTISETSFRKYFRRQQRWYPQQAAHGWMARLNCYFWPNLLGTWEQTQEELGSYINRFRSITQSPRAGVEGTSDDLVSLFEEICVWGGVKLPESDPERLCEEVFRTLETLDRNEVPERGHSRLNSAWTKLYAIARPDSFVIFDSRVATALVSILDPYMNDLVNGQHFHKVQGLGTVPGRGGSRPRSTTWNWPVGYQSWQAQLCANKLCSDIVAYLNNTPAINDQHEWTLREVEAVLFMEGY